MSSFCEPFKVSYLLNCLILYLEIFFHHLGYTHNDTAGIEIIVESFALPQKFRREQKIELLNPPCGIFHIQTACIAHRNGRLNDHHRIWVHLQHCINHFFNVASVKEILLDVIVSRCSNHHKVSILVTSLLVKGCLNVERLVGKIILNVVIFYR